MPESEEPKQDEPAGDPNAANFAAIKQIRELAKWLIVILGGLGGVLIAGSQLSDVGATGGCRLVAAFVGVGLGLLGVGIAIAYTIDVLMPRRMDLSRLLREGSDSPAAKLVEEEPEALLGQGETIEELRTNLDAKRTEEEKARKALEDAEEADANGDHKDLEDALKDAEEELDEVELARQEFLGYARVEEVKATMKRALIAIAIGSAIAAFGIVLFAWASHPDEPKTEEPAAVEAVPKQPSAVSVNLSDHGMDVLTKRVGDGCPANPLHAIALGGEPDALDLVSIPTAKCQATRFTLTENMGTVVSDETVELPAPEATP